jgi:hypothetical protein
MAQTFDALVAAMERKPLEWLADNLPHRSMRSGKMRPVSRRGEAIELAYRRKVVAQPTQQARRCTFHGRYGCDCGQ